MMRPVLRLSALGLILLAVPVLAMPPAVGASQSADEIIEKHLAAVGGRAALGKVTTRRATGTVTLGTANGDLSGTFEALYKAPNKVRIQISLDLSAMGMAEKLAIEQRFDGVAFWVLNSLQGDNEITGNQLENMKNGVFPSPFLGYKDRGMRVEVQPNELVAGKNAIVLLVTPKSGSVSRVYLDPDTYLVMKSSAKVTSAEMGELTQVGEPSDYRDVDGIKVPFRVVNTSEVQTVTVVLSKVEHNVAADDAQFSVKK